MFKPNLKYLKFYHRKMILLGVPLITFLLPLMFYGLSLSQYLSNFALEFADGLLFTITYTLFIRYLIIALRKRYESVDNPLKRLTTQFFIIVLSVPHIMLITGGILHAT